MTTIAWVWLAALGGFLLGWLTCIALVRPDQDDEVDVAELERLFRL